MTHFAMLKYFLLFEWNLACTVLIALATTCVHKFPLYISCMSENTLTPCSYNVSLWVLWLLKLVLLSSSEKAPSVWSDGFCLFTCMQLRHFPCRNWTVSLVWRASEQVCCPAGKWKCHILIQCTVLFSLCWVCLVILLSTFWQSVLSANEDS